MSFKMPYTATDGPEPDSTPYPQQRRSTNKKVVITVPTEAMPDAQAFDDAVQAAKVTMDIID